MLLKNLLLRTFSVIAIGSGILFAPVGHAQATKGQYVTIEPAQPSDTTGKTEGSKAT